MTRRLQRVLGCVALGLVVTLLAVAHGLPAAAQEAYDWGLPAWFPRPVVPDDNPMTEAKVDLGRHLFYDTRLSITGAMSCATCHDQARAFSDGRRTGLGATGQVHPRNPQALVNVAYNPVLTWANPALDRIETQVLLPLFGEDPIEMGLAGREQQLLDMLRDDPSYPERFATAFPEQTEPISVGSVTKALASFVRSLVSANSPYDRYRYGGDPAAISESAKRGEALFFSEELECHHCHGGINFTDAVVHERLARPEVAFHNTGLYNIDGRGAYPPRNTGVREITSRPEDMGRFRTPTLRNVALTAPYMHDGSVASLEAVLDHYAAGGRTIPDGPLAGSGRRSPLKDVFVSGFSMTPQQRADLLAFLNSLTDEDFVTNPSFADPFAVPRS
jgi:cytochrome c peroxidase